MRRMISAPQYRITGWQSGNIQSDGGFGYRDNTGSLVWDTGANTNIYKRKTQDQNPFRIGVGYDVIPNITLSFPTALTTKPDHIVFKTYGIKFQNGGYPDVEIKCNNMVDTPLVLTVKDQLVIMGQYWGKNSHTVAVSDVDEASMALYDQIQEQKGYIDEPQAVQEEDESYLMIPATKFDLVNGKIVLHADALPAVFRYKPNLHIAVIPCEEIA